MQKVILHGLWQELTGSGKLRAHLPDIDKTAQERMDRMLPHLSTAQLGLRIRKYSGL